MKKFFLLFFLFCIAATWTLAQPPIPEPMGRWVVDDANILSEATEKTVSTLCFKEYQSSSNQIMVYTFASLQGGTIESYANEVYNNWKIGTKDNNNGVLLIIAVDDHKMRIEVGYGLESYLTDLESKDIINNEIKPRFKEGDFDNGVINGVQNIIYGIKNSYVASGTTTTSSANSTSVGWPFFIIGIIWLALAVFSSRMQLAEGIMAMVFFGIFLISFAIIVLSFGQVAILVAVGIGVTILLNKIWKPKKPIKFFRGSSGGGSWSGSSGSSWGSSYNSSSSSSYSSGSDYGGFSGGGGSSGGGGASGDW